MYAYGEDDEWWRLVILKPGWGFKSRRIFNVNIGIRSGGNFVSWWAMGH